MDRQVVSRLVLLISILTMVTLAALGDASPTLVLAIAVPFGFVAAAIFLLGVPFAAVRKAEESRLGWKKLLDVAEHAGPLAWIDLMILWAVSAVAFMGLSANTLERVIFGATFVIGLIAALRDLYLSEEPDDEQESWQEHPQ